MGRRGAEQCHESGFSGRLRYTGIMRNNRFTQIVIWVVVLGMVLSMAIMAASLFG